MHEGAIAGARRDRAREFGRTGRGFADVECAGLVVPAILDHEAIPVV